MAARLIRMPLALELPRLRALVDALALPQGIYQVDTEIARIQESKFRLTGCFLELCLHLRHLWF